MRSCDNIPTLITVCSRISFDYRFLTLYSGHMGERDCFENSREPRGASRLMCRTEMAERGSSIVRGEPPFDRRSQRVPDLLPRCDRTGTVLRYGTGRSRHWAERTASSISAALSQLPYFGVWWISTLSAIRLASTGGNAW